MAEKNKEQEETTKKKKIPLWLYLPFAVVFLGACAGAYIFGMNNNPFSDSNKKAEMKEKKDEKLGPMIELDDFVVNILDGEQMHYLKASITLEAENDKTKSEVENRNPQIRDSIILLMGNKKYDELRDLQGKLQLRAELLKKINSLLPEGKIKNVYFTEFVVQ